MPLDPPSDRPAHTRPPADAGGGLPDRLVRSPLLRADAHAAGITDHELRGPMWAQPLRGVNRWAAGRADGPATRIAEVAAVLPAGAAISGWASLWQHGARDLDGYGDLRVQRIGTVPPSRAQADPPMGTRSRDGRTARRDGRVIVLAPILVCTGPAARMRPRRDIDISRRVLADDDVVVIGGVPFVKPAPALLDLMGRQPADEALASVDSALHSETVTLESVQAYLDEHPRLYGAPKIRRVLDLADGRARSRQESRFRWIWVVEAGLPRPEVNREICDGMGFTLGIPDLLDLDSAVAGEFDGADHRRPRQHTADNIREELFERHGLIVVRATNVDLTTRRTELVRRLLAAHQDGLSRDRSRDRWYLRSL